MWAKLLKKIKKDEASTTFEQKVEALEKRHHVAFEIQHD
jgi:hypothetical protein